MLNMDGIIFPNLPSEDTGSENLIPNPMHPPKRPLFAPPIPHFTVQEEFLETTRRVNETLTRVLNLEKVLTYNFENNMQALAKDNETFKEVCINTYNGFAQRVHDEINTFETELLNAYQVFQKTIQNDYADFNVKYDAFKNNVENLYNDLEANLSQIINAKFETQDAEISSAVEYLKNNLYNTVVNAISDMQSTGVFTALIQEALAANLITEERFTELTAGFATKNELNVQKARIDSFVALPEGTTTGDAELLDARIGYNSTKYSGLGEAIRTQISDLHSSKVSVENVSNEVGTSKTKIASQYALMNAMENVTSNVANAIREKTDDNPFITSVASDNAHGVNIRYSAKNLIPYPYEHTSKVAHGITFTDNGDGSVTVKGTAEQAVFFNLCRLDFGQGYINTAGGIPTNGEYCASGLFISYNPDNKITAIEISAGRTVDLVIYPQVEKGTTPSPWERYVNIPAIKVFVGGKNLIPYPYIDTTKTVNGITFIDIGDGRIHAKGTATDNAYFNLCKVPFSTSFLNSQNSQKTDGKLVISGYNVAFNPPNGLTYISIPGGHTVDVIIEPQIEVGVEPTEWEKFVCYPESRIKANNIKQPYLDNTKTANGITFTVQPDGGIHVVGTATAPAYFDLCRSDFGEAFIKKDTMSDLYITHTNHLVYNPENGLTALDIPAGTEVNEVVYPVMYDNTAKYIVHQSVDGSMIAMKPKGKHLSVYVMNESVHVESEYIVDTLHAVAKQTSESVEEAMGSFEGFKYDSYGLPVLYLNGDTAGMSKDNKKSLAYKYEGMDGGCTLKLQGSSSLNYPKKNYTIQFDKAFEVKHGWGSERKYCLKANYIDFSHARNICSAKIWGEIVKSRKNETNLFNLPNGGAIDGFPVFLVINGEYQGIYTFNIPKDDWMFGMNGNGNEAIICADIHGYGTRFKAEIDLLNDFELEYCSTTDSQWVIDSVNELISLCIESDGDNLNAIKERLDIESAIDYYIFTSLIKGEDMLSKNYILATYDGAKWFFSAYDMDSVFGLYWDGKTILEASGGISTPKTYAKYHTVMELIKTYMLKEYKERYSELRKSILSVDNVATVFANFINKIPSAAFDREATLWTGIPSTSVNNLSQIVDWYRRRCEIVDAEVESM